MIKLVKMIVDENYKLIGFIAEGKSRDFGELGNETVTKPVSMKYLFDTNFTNKQVAVKRGMITEKDGFKLNKLPMVMLSGSNYFGVDNSIEITKRYVQNNENVGFEVLLGNGTKHKFTYENVIKLCDMFNPTNFVIRYGAENKRFIAGKAGCSLQSLPYETIGEEIKAKRTRSTTKAVEKITGGFVNEVDIMDLYDFIRSVNGFIINLPGSKYVATTESSAVAKEFVPFNIGEVGTPWLDFNETKFNVSCNFKKPGAVAIETTPGRLTNIITFVYRRKNVFFNANNYISNLGVVVPNSADAALIEKFGRTMSFTEITDIGLIQPISMLIAQQGVKFYSVDTSKIGLIARGKIDSLVIPTADLYKKVLELNYNKYIIKYLNGLVKDLKESGGFTSGEKVKDIAPQFAAMKESELISLTENGIDIHTGAFTNKDESRKTSGAATDDIVEVGYAIDGMNLSSLSYNQMIKGGDKVPGFLQTVISKFESIDSFEEKGVKAREMLDMLESANSKLKRELWMHKCAMYLKSNRSSIHSHDKKNWELNTKKRTKAKCYNCTLKGCEKLQLLLTNVDI